MNNEINNLPNNPNIQVLKPRKTGLFTNYIFKAIPLAFDESMSYYECLCGLLDYLKNTILPVLNNNADAIEELQSLYVELKSYVDNYFTNLDVQEEINNKLDEMAESGQLTDIIAQYLGLAGMITFNNVSEMKLAENLVNGSKCCTMGYYNVNDGGNALYKVRTITNEDVVDEKSIIALYDNNLIAELITDPVIKGNAFGLYGNNTNDDTSNLQALLTNNENNAIDLNTKSIYKTSNVLNVNNSIDGNKATINSSTGAIKIDNNAKNNVIQNLNINSENYGINVGDSGTEQTPSNLPNRNIVINNKIISEHGNRLRVGTNGNTHGKNVFILNNIKTTGSDDDDVGIESWNGDSSIVLNSIIKDGEEVRTGSSGITLGLHDGQKALFNIIEGFKYGIESGNTNKNTLIFGNTIRNCKYPIGLTTNGYEKDTLIGYNYIELSDNDDIGISGSGNEDIRISNTIIRWVGEGIGSTGINLINHAKRLFIDNCIFININSPINTIPQTEEVIISNTSFINCSNRLISTQAQSVIIDKCYFEECGVLYQYANNTYFQKFVVENCTFYHTSNSTLPEYVLSGRGLNTLGVFESNNNTFINCKENPMKTNTEAGADKRALLFKKDGLYYSFNKDVFSDLLTSITAIGCELQPGDKIYDNYTKVTYELVYPMTRYGQDFVHYEYNRSQAPSTGAFKKGDKIFNNYTSNTSVQGWVCTTSGTFGTETEPVFTTF